MDTFLCVWGVSGLVSKRPFHWYVTCLSLGLGLGYILIQSKKDLRFQTWILTFLQDNGFGPVLHIRMLICPHFKYCLIIVCNNFVMNEKMPNERHCFYFLCIENIQGCVFLYFNITESFPAVSCSESVKHTLWPSWGCADKLQILPGCLTVLISV